MHRRPRPLRDPAAAARQAKRESKYVDFKESFDPADKGEWCELLKDLVAMANSGGGIVVVGWNDKGQHSGKPVNAVLDLDPATITDKFVKYTGGKLRRCEHSEGNARWTVDCHLCGGRVRQPAGLHQARNLRVSEWGVRLGHSARVLFTFAMAQRASRLPGLIFESSLIGRWPSRARPGWGTCVRSSRPARTPWLPSIVLQAATLPTSRSGFNSRQIQTLLSTVAST
jgi:hypothetical protein